MRTSEILFSRVEEENRKALENLKQKLHSSAEKNSWILCLGAGVSISVGLPNWYELLAKISAQLLPMSGDYADTKSAYYKDVRGFYEKLNYDSTFLDKMSDAFKGEYKEIFEHINVLEGAEYIRNFVKFSLQCSNEDEKDKEKGSKGYVDHCMGFLIQQACSIDIEVNDSNKKLHRSTLAAVARLMKSEKDHLIHNAITYNYDNLLETYLREICKCDQDRVHSIVKKDMLRDIGDQEDWNIYHVHGRVPVVPHAGEEKSEGVILAESDYYEEEQINYSWLNILQSYAMFRSNLIFIGFSGTDYNFRRIIKYVNKEDAKKHEKFIFFSVDDIVRAVFAKETGEKKDIEDCVREMNEADSKYAFEKLFINYLINAQTVYWKDHGLNVIWSSHEQLYDDLEQLHM